MSKSVYKVAQTVERLFHEGKMEEAQRYVEALAHIGYVFRKHPMSIKASLYYDEALDCRKKRVFSKHS